MGKSYSCSTIMRYQALERRGINCVYPKGLCLKKAVVVYTILVENRKQCVVRFCRKHAEIFDKLKHTNFVVTNIEIENI